MANKPDNKTKRRLEKTTQNRFLKAIGCDSITGANLIKF